MSKPVSESQFCTRVNKFLCMVSYACIEDMRSSTGDDNYNPNLYQTYTNYMREKASQVEGMKAAITYQSKIHYHLLYFFNKMIEEIAEVNPSEPEVEAIINEIEATVGDPCTPSMWRIARAYESRFGPTLKSAGDPTQWFQAQITGQLKHYASKPMMSAMIANHYEMFLRAIAWLITPLGWFSGSALKAQEAHLLTLLYQNNMPLDVTSGSRAFVEERAKINEGRRTAAPRKKPQKKSEKDAPADSASEPESAKTNTPTPAAPLNNRDDLADLLDKV